MTTDPMEAPGRDPEESARLIKLAVIGGAVILIGLFAFFLIQAMSEETSRERWDVYDALRRKHEPQTDPLWRNPYGVYNSEREAYIGALEAFLTKAAEEEDDALAPHTRYAIAKTVADHILSNPGILNQADRSKFYKQATDNLEALRDQYPEFPLNWSSLSEEGFPSLTRQFINWLRENQAWEKEHMMQAAEPAAGVRVLIRTDRGDMLMGLYSEQAPLWSSAFIEHALRGHYDGTFFNLKTRIGDVATPEVHTLLAGGDATRDLKPYDQDAAAAAAKVEVRSGLMPEASRNRIPQDRGVISAWHPEGDTYDNDSRFLVTVRRSPRMDYDYTPFGKLVEEDGVESNLTMERIFGGEVWQKDSTVREEPDLRPILDYLQVPVKILKVLVYENGSLKSAGEGVLPAKAKVESTEAKLSTVKADRYKTEPPANPNTPDDAEDDE